MIDTPTKPLDFAAARKAMLDSQLRTCGVNAPFVLRRMGSVAREDFAPADAHGFCYMDRSIALPGGATLAQPVAHGKILELAHPKPTDSVLVVDNSAGYLTALIEPLAAKVTTATPQEAAAGKKRGSFDLIVVDGAIEACPPALAKRLASGGRIVCGLVRNGVTSLAEGRSSGKDIAFRTVDAIALPQLAAFDTPKGWSF